MEEKNQLQVITPTEIEVLVSSNIIPKGTPTEQIQVFARVCAEKNLSPFSRQIYLIPRKGKYTIQTGIDGYRALADRTKAYAGNDDYLFDDGLTQYQMLNSKKTKPTIAISTVYKIVGGLRVPFTASAEWGAYYPGDDIGFMWKKMPFLMLGKCAEALAMRKAFPETLSGIYTDEEMQQADYKEIPKVEIKPEEVKPEEPKEPEFALADLQTFKTTKDLTNYFKILSTEAQEKYKPEFTKRNLEITNAKVKGNGK